MICDMTVGVSFWLYDILTNTNNVKFQNIFRILPGDFKMCLSDVDPECELFLGEVEEGDNSPSIEKLTRAFACPA